MTPAVVIGVMRKNRYQVSGIRYQVSGIRYQVYLKARPIDKNTLWSSEGKGVKFRARSGNGGRGWNKRARYFGYAGDVVMPRVAGYRPSGSLYDRG